MRRKKLWFNSQIDGLIEYHAVDNQIKADLGFETTSATGMDPMALLMIQTGEFDDPLGVC